MNSEDTLLAQNQLINQRIDALKKKIKKIPPNNITHRCNYLAFLLSKIVVPPPLIEGRVGIVVVIALEILIPHVVCFFLGTI